MSNPFHILVTGARGAIGRSVVRIARDSGNIVTGIGHGSWSGDHELPSIDGWINGDVTPLNLWAFAELYGTPDAIIHLAGGSHVGMSVQQPAEDFKRTVVATQHLLEWVRAAAPQTKLVIASSGAVYGAGHVGPICESAAYDPASPYATHKAMMEIIARGYANQFSLNVVILRIFSVYGPGLRKQLIWEVTDRLMRGERQITLGGTGLEQRDFVEISDVAAMLLGSIALATPAARVINCASNTSTAVHEVASYMKAHFPSAKFVFTGISRPGDPPNLVGDDRIARASGFLPSVQFAQGFDKTIAWIRASLADVSLS